MTDFPGSIFVGTDRLAATVTVRSTGLTAIAHQLRWDFSWSELTFSHGAMALVTHRDGRTVACDAPGFIAALAENAPLGFVGAVRQPRSSRGLFGCGTLLVLVLGLLIGLGVAVWVGIPWAAGKAVDAMPPTVDRELGDAGYRQMDLGGPKISIPVVDETIADMVRRIAPHAAKPFDFRIQIVESDTINAFCLPGGQIVVYTGLIRKATRAEHVAGVIAHEMAHATLRHGLRGMATQLGIALGVQILTGDVTGMAGQIATGALSNSYSREAEFAADAEGARMLAAAGIDPAGMAEFFASMESSGIPSWLSTHPDAQDRIAALHRLIPSLPGPSHQLLTGDWAKVQQALARTP